MFSLYSLGILGVVFKENKCICFCKSNENWSKTTKTYFCFLINKNCTDLKKILDWYWSKNSTHIAYPVSKRLTTLLLRGHLLWEEDGAIELWRLKSPFSERIWELSTFVWWNVEEQNGRRRRQQEKSSIMHWSVKTRNSYLPSSSRSIRTQSHWSFTRGRCVIRLSNLEDIRNQVPERWRSHSKVVGISTLCRLQEVQNIRVLWDNCFLDLKTGSNAIALQKESRSPDSLLSHLWSWGIDHELLPRIPRAWCWLWILCRKEQIKTREFSFSNMERIQEWLTLA